MAAASPPPPPPGPCSTPCTTPACPACIQQPLVPSLTQHKGMGSPIQRLQSWCAWAAAEDAAADASACLALHGRPGHVPYHVWCPALQGDVVMCRYACMHQGRMPVCMQRTELSLALRQSSYMQSMGGATDNNQTLQHTNMNQGRFRKQVSCGHLHLSARSAHSMAATGRGQSGRSCKPPGCRISANLSEVNSDALPIFRLSEVNGCCCSH